MTELLHGSGFGLLHLLSPICKAGKRTESGTLVNHIEHSKVSNTALLILCKSLSCVFLLGTFMVYCLPSGCDLCGGVPFSEMRDAFHSQMVGSGAFFFGPVCSFLSAFALLIASD